MIQPKLSLGVKWESRDAEGVAVAVDHRTRTVRNEDGSTRHMDRIFVCFLNDILDLLPEEEIPAAPSR